MFLGRDSERITGEQLKELIKNNAGAPILDKPSGGGYQHATTISLPGRHGTAVWHLVPCTPPAKAVQVYGGFSAGSATANTPGQTTQTGSIGIFNGATPNSFNPSATGFAYGAFVGVQAPVDGFIQYAGFHLNVGAEVGITGFGGVNSTVIGITGGPFGTDNGKDTFKYKDNWALTAGGVVSFPIMQAMTASLTGGFALVNKTATYNCVTFCDVAPSYPQFSDSHDVNLPGWYLGAGFSVPFNPPGFFPGTIGVDYKHLFLNDKDVTFGTLPTRMVNQNFSQDINMVSARVSWPLQVYASDIRLKRDIVELARLDNGLGLYRYRYRWSDETYVGVMAQEVAEIVPDAVLLGADGYLRVDYSRLGLRLMTWDEWTAAAHRLPLAA